MKPIDIPPATVKAHGAAYVSVSAPLDFEFSDGTKPGTFEGMRIGDVVYTLIGIETDGELEALSRTRCFYLGFFSGNIPIFTVRVADVAFGEAPTEEDLPAIADNFDLHQQARDSWPTILNGDVAWMKIKEKSRFIQKVGTDERHQDIFMADIVEAGSCIIHSFVTGKTIIVPDEWMDFLYDSGVKETGPKGTQEPQEPEELHNSGEEQKRVRKKIPEL